MNKGSVDYERWQQLKESSRSTNLSPRNEKQVRRARTPLLGKSGRDVSIGNSYSNLELSNSRKQFTGVSGTKRDISATRSMKRATITTQGTSSTQIVNQSVNQNESIAGFGVLNQSQSKDKVTFEKECADLVLKEKNLL